MCLHKCRTKGFKKKEEWEGCEKRETRLNLKGTKLTGDKKR